MKLFTEKDVTEMILKTRKFGFTAEYLIITTEGISLPSDEEIKTMAIKSGLERISVVFGADWLIEQTKNQKR